MTSLAFTFGVLPLMLSKGAGAEMRRTIGTAVFWGMLGVTLFGIFLTPVFYVVIRRVLEGKRIEGADSPSGVTGAVISLAVLGAGSVLLLSGCAVGPKYQPPQTKVTAAFANGSQTNFSSDETVAAWWRGFNDPLLNRLVDRALLANHDLRIAAARLREARALRSATVLESFPIVHAAGSYTKGVNSKDSMHGQPRDFREMELYNAGFDAAWELDVFGRVRRSMEASSAEVSALEAARGDLLVTLLAEVARNYFDLRGLQHEVEVARQNAENQRQTLELIEAKLKAGRASDLDVARARAQLNATLAIVPPMEAALKRATYRLSVLAGEPPLALEPELAAAAPLPALPALVQLGRPEDLLRRRRDIRAAERALAAATARIGVATADLFPRVTFNARLALEAGEVSGLGKSGADTYSLGPRISWAALDLGRVRARIKAAGARADAALAQYEKTVLAALEETEGALMEFGRVQTRCEYLTASARAAAEAVKLARQRYESGVADFLAVLDAQRVELSIQDQLAQSETRTATALVAVYKALGGGWEIDQTGAAAAKRASASALGGN
jgi:multidrug efflux system outer membrane protein